MSGLSRPAAFSVAPDGSVFFAQAGTVRVRSPRGTLTTVLADPGLTGVLGMTLAPGFPTTRGGKSTG